MMDRNPQQRRFLGVLYLLLFVGGYVVLRIAAWLLSFVADHWWQLSLGAVLTGGAAVYFRSMARERRQARWHAQRTRGRSN